MIRPRKRVHDFEVLTLPGDLFQFEQAPGPNTLDPGNRMRFTSEQLPQAQDQVTEDLTSKDSLPAMACRGNGKGQPPHQKQYRATGLLKTSVSGRCHARLRQLWVLFHERFAEERQAWPPQRLVLRHKAIRRENRSSA